MLQALNEKEMQNNGTKQKSLNASVQPGEEWKCAFKVLKKLPKRGKAESKCTQLVKVGSRENAKDERVQRRCKQGAGWLSKLTKAKPWRGGTQVIQDLEQDACPTQSAEHLSDGWGKQRRVFDLDQR